MLPVFARAHERDTAQRMTIEQRWREHLSASFPKRLRGTEIDGIELVLLDADAAGCIQSFIDSGGELSLVQTARLGLLLRDLTRVVPRLADDERGYFARLQSLSEQILERIASGLSGA